MCVEQAFISILFGALIESLSKSLKGVHSIELVTMYEVVGLSASLMIVLRHSPAGPTNGCLLIYSDSPGASPINMTSTLLLRDRVCSLWVTLCLQISDISHLLHSCVSCDHLVASAFAV